MSGPGGNGYFKYHPRADLNDTMHLMQNRLCTRIVLLLSGGPLDVSTIGNTLGLKQSHVSHGLGMLRTADLLEATQQKKNRIYELTPLVRIAQQGTRMRVAVTCINEDLVTFETTITPSLLPVWRSDISNQVRRK